MKRFTVFILVCTFFLSHNQASGEELSFDDFVPPVK